MELNFYKKLKLRNVFNYLRTLKRKIRRTISDGQTFYKNKPKEKFKN